MQLMWWRISGGTYSICFMLTFYSMLKILKCHQVLSIVIFIRCFLLLCWILLFLFCPWMHHLLTCDLFFKLPSSLLQHWHTYFVGGGAQEGTFPAHSCLSLVRFRSSTWPASMAESTLWVYMFLIRSEYLSKTRLIYGILFSVCLKYCNFRLQTGWPLEWGSLFRVMKRGEDVSPLLLLLNNQAIGWHITSKEEGGGGWTAWVVELGHLTLLMINQPIWSSKSLRLHSDSQLLWTTAIPVAWTRGVLWKSKLIVDVILWWNRWIV